MKVRTVVAEALGTAVSDPHTLGQNELFKMGAVHTEFSESDREIEE